MFNTPSNHGESESVDFFISRAGAQANIAKLIGNVLEDAGHSTILQDWDFHDKNFIERMHDALKRASRVILLLSPEYLASPYCTAEWTNAMAGDPLNKHGRVIFFRVAECAPDGMLRGMAYLDLVSLFKQGNDAILREIILAAIRPGRQRNGPVEGFWRTSKPILHGKIRPQPNFTGRRSDLDALGRVLTFATTPEIEKNLPPRAAIHGLPGAGKSVLAIQYAWKNQGRYGGIWWIPAGTPEDIARGLVNLGSQFLPGVKDMQDRELAVATTFELLASGGFDKPWLLIFDDVESPQMLRPFTPAAGATVIITSRWSDWTGEATSFPLGVLPPSDAVDFLLRRTERDDWAGAERLARALGYLPLALTHAGAYCKHIGESFVSYAGRLPELIQRAPKGSDYERTVFATFSTACDAATALCNDASIVMAIVAFLAPDDIPVDLIDDNIVTRSSRDSALEALAMLSLILVRAEPSGAVIDVHRLVQAVTRLQIQARGQSTEELRRVYDIFDRNLPHEIWETEDAAASVFAAGDIILQTHFGAPESVQILPPNEDLKYFLTYMRAKRDEAQGEQRRSFDRIVGHIFALGADAEKYGVPVDHNHAQVWRRWAGLLPHTIVLATNVEDLLGKGRHTSRLLAAIAAISYSQGRPDELIEFLLKHSARDAEAVPPSERPVLAQSLRNLSYFLTERKRRDEAEPLLVEALSIDVDAFGPEHPNSVRDALRLAALLYELDRPDDARSLTRETMDTVKNAFGDSESWPRDVEHAFGQIAIFEFSKALEKVVEEKKAERKLRSEVAQEFRRLKSAAVRQRMLGLIFYVAGAILSVLAIASILGRYLELAYPLRPLLDVYRTGIHRPLMSLNHFVMPNWQIPNLAWDALSTWIAFWLAANASLLRLEGKTVFGKLSAISIEFGLSMAKRYMVIVLGSLAISVFGPPFFLYWNVRNGLPIDPESKGLLAFLATVISCLVAIFLLNQQLKSLG